MKSTRLALLSAVCLISLGCGADETGPSGIEPGDLAKASDREQEGWDVNGCNFNGAWLSTWDSPSGWYTGIITLTQDSDGVSGTYDYGTIDTIYTGYDGNGRPVIAGKWTITTGHSSGGPCQYGTMQFALSYDYSAAEHTCRLDGAWNYCSSIPQYSWTATQWTP